MKPNPWRKFTAAEGFTLVEVLIVLAISSILLASVTGVFIRSGRVYTTQNATAALQQEVRLAMEYMVGEMRMAAYNPRRGEVSFAIKTASPIRFRFEADLDENGERAKSTNTDGDCENRSFRYSLVNTGIQIVCGEGTSSTSPPQYILGGTDANVRVTQLDFAYRDRNNKDTKLVSEIRSAVITITAQAPAGSEGWIERTYRTVVDFRNAGRNS
ncbi:PilW family protein [Desulfobulbus sp.]|uniref:PilW family protein n=1 Tax=Desulfobulbus sp. TaxID=895 RepID=UPI0027B880A9|nr:prepilin-type N-terminal cleavage/methylation domain-containing protein [Desulfobulbus sp.]